MNEKIVWCLWQLVVDWLEGLARAGLEQYSAKAAYFADNVCWENTLHDLTHGVDCDVLVTEMVRNGSESVSLLNVDVRRTLMPPPDSSVSSLGWTQGMSSLSTSISSRASELVNWTWCRSLCVQVVSLAYFFPGPGDMC